MMRSAWLFLALLAPLAQGQRSWFVDLANPGCPGSGTFSDPFCRIQDAIAAAFGGDTVWVAPGRYREVIDFYGKAITVRSRHGAERTTIDAETRGPVVIFQSGEGLSSALVGFTLTGGASLQGGGIQCIGSSPFIESCRITGNRAFDFGSGGGIYCSSASPVILNSFIVRNTTTGFATGAGIFCRDGSQPFILNSTVAGNRSDSGGGGLALYSSSPRIINSIIWGNPPRAIDADLFSRPDVTFSDVEGGFEGMGNLAADPLFRDPAPGSDYRLTCDSPCVDAGTPHGAVPRFDQEGRDLRMIGRLDMGADEVGLQWTLTGAPRVGGPPVHFTATAGPSQPASSLAEVYLSLGDGSTGGLPVPLGGGRALGLQSDGLFGLWQGLPQALRQVAAAVDCRGRTTLPFSLPPATPVGVRFYYAGVSWDLGRGTATSVTETRSRVTE